MHLEDIVAAGNNSAIEKIVPIKADPIVLLKAQKESKKIVRLCPKCRSKNMLPEHIKYGSKYKCSACNYLLLDINFPEEISTNEAAIHSKTNVNSGAYKVNYDESNVEYGKILDYIYYGYFSYSWARVKTNT